MKKHDKNYKHNSLSYILREYIKHTNGMVTICIVSYIGAIISKCVELKTYELGNNIILKIHKATKNETYLNIVQFIIWGIGHVVLKGIISRYCCKAKTIVFLKSMGLIYKHFLNTRGAQFNRSSIAYIESVMVNRSMAIQTLVDIVLLSFVPRCIGIFTICLKLSSVCNIKTAILLMITVIFYFLASLLMQKERNKLRIVANKSLDICENVIYNGLLNHEVVKTSATEDYEDMYYKDCTSYARDCEVRFDQSLYGLKIASDILWKFGCFLILYANIDDTIQESSKNKITRLIGIFASVYTSLSGTAELFRQYTIAMTRLQEKSLEKNNLNTSKQDIKIESIDTIKIGEIIINKGDKVLVFGPNGSGKSLVLKSMVKYHTNNYDIKYNNTNINEIQYKDVSHLIAYIPQNITLFENTVMYNIKYGNFDLNEMDIHKLAIKLGVHSMFDKRKNGYRANCGKNGNYLSGGEKACVMLLRTLCSQKELLILDEPTAHISRDLEDKFLDQIMSGSHTTVITMHKNLHTDKFDKILKIEDGLIKQIK